MANYIMQIFRAYAMMVFSWGFDNPYPTERRRQTPPKVVADFLQRSSKQGWASKAKPIPNLIIKKKANTAEGGYLFLTRDNQTEIGEQSEGNPHPNTTTNSKKNAGICDT